MSLHERLDDSEKLGVLFTEGRKEWTKIISRFVKKHIEKCDPDILFSDFKVIPTGSGSSSGASIVESSLIYSGLNVKGKEEDKEEVETYKRLIGEEREDDYYKNSCVIKASWGRFNLESDFDYLDNSLDVEIQIYKYGVKKIIKHSPFVLQSYGVTTCVHNINELKEKLMKNAKKKVNEDGKEIYNDDGNPILEDIEDMYETDKINLLFLEKSSSYSLGNWIRDNDDFTLFLNLSFQLYWTLHVMRRLNIKHNDLTFRNIFVDVLKEDITLYFKLPEDAPVDYRNKYVKLKTKYFLRVYDFDRSSAIGYPNIDRNILIDKQFCEDRGTCNYSFDIYDLWTATQQLNNFYALDIFDFVEKDKYKDKHLLPHLNNMKEKREIEKRLKNKLVNLIYSILSENNKYKHKFCEIEDSIKDGVVCYQLPEQKEIVNYNPKCSYKYSEMFDNKEDKEKPFIADYNKIYEMAKKEVNIDTNKFLKIFEQDHEFISYDIYDKIAQLYIKYMSKRNIVNKEDTVIVLKSCMYLSSPVYHKIASTHIKDNKKLINQYISDSVNSIRDYIKITNYIDDIWATFDGKLPIEIPMI